MKRTPPTPMAIEAILASGRDCTSSHDDWDSSCLKWLLKAQVFDRMLAAASESTLYKAHAASRCASQHSHYSSTDAHKDVRLPRPAARLMHLATRLLPTADRARYGEEYREELWSLAEAGAGRWRQFACASRQLFRAPALRFVLKAPIRRRASS